MKFEEAKSILEGKSYKLIPTEKRQNGHRVFSVICPEGHELNQTLSNICAVLWKRGCSLCNKKAHDNWLQETQKKWETEGFKVNERVGKKVLITCPAKHTIKIKQDTYFNRSPRCQTCFTKNFEIKFKKVLNQRVAEGHQILNPQEMKIICPRGHEYEMSRSHFADGQRCGVCAGKNKDFYFSELKRSIEKEGWKLITKNYINNSSPLELLDPNGNLVLLSADVWKRGYRSNKTLKTIEELKPEFEKEGYKINEPSYINAFQKLALTCPKNHSVKITYNHWSQGVRCKYCGVNSSKVEKEWLKKIKEIYPSAQKAHVEGVEIDIWIPEIKTGIEICGGLYHSEAVLYLFQMTKEKWESRKRHLKKSHYKKYKRLKEAGLRLLTVFDRDIPKMDLFLKRLSPKIRLEARKCKVQSIPKDTAIGFLQSNHLQGSALHSSFFFGLLCEGKVVGCLTFGPHIRKGHSKKEIVLDRLCFSDYSVVGGAEKLFSFALKNLPQNFKEIISWSDNRYAEGGVYSRLGFFLEEELPPDYSYINLRTKEYASKQALKKTEAEKSSELTEHELRAEQGWYRIWDCGKIRWRYKRT